MDNSLLDHCISTVYTAFIVIHLTFLVVALDYSV
ncbi:hypothetical protein [Vibrio phage vB_VpaP_M9]|nr:hypothetical protein [Vibrio phage vB_VpaP_M83]USL89854.1 hypothetical protein [Vibrio phage vB_VpaP_M9]